MARGELMSKSARDRAYRLHIELKNERLLFRVLYPEQMSRGNRAVAEFRTREPDLLRMLKGLRAKYKIPTPNVHYVGFETNKLVGVLGVEVLESSHAEDQTHLEKDRARNVGTSVFGVPEMQEEDTDPTGDRTVAPPGEVRESTDDRGAAEETADRQEVLDS